MNTITFILLIINILIGLWLIFFKSYFSEKGKNIATQEDIGAITKEIETIKSEISKKNVFEKEQKEIVFSFFDIAYNFIDYTAQVNRLANNLDDLELIQSYAEEVRNKSAQVFSAFSKVLIYFNTNGQIVKTAGDFYDTAVKFQHSVNELLFQLEQLAKMRKLMIDSLNNGDLSFQKKISNNIDVAKQLMTTHINEIRPLQEESYKNRSAFIFSLTQLIKSEKNE
jgi:hypothetical protein